MIPSPRDWLLSLTFMLLSLGGDQARLTTIENGVKSAVYLSPEMIHEPGSVINKFYYDIDFPRGHIAIKSFFAELVDDEGNSVPLHETYLHHWHAARYYVQKGVEVPDYSVDKVFETPGFFISGNSGVCKPAFPQFFGLGSETRKTDMYIPHPYGIEVGNPAHVPQGFEEKWHVAIHAIDTRDVEDKLGCTECRCNLYNVTVDANGQPLNRNYEGGLKCCYDETKCKLKQGFQNVERRINMRYTVEWVDWDSSIVPVKVYIFDVTDTANRTNGSNDLVTCQIEYDVESCPNGIAKDQCFDTKRAFLRAPSSGDIIYGVGHLHTAGVSSALYGEDERVLCKSVPEYGDGKESGNEAGYIVGMSACYPKPGSVKIYEGETLIVESIYSSAEKHTGVMGLIYILVAESQTSGLESLSTASTQIRKMSRMRSYASIQVMFGVVVAVALAAIVVFAYRRRSLKEDGYESLVT